jgi:hypothetical protein
MPCPRFLRRIGLAAGLCISGAALSGCIVVPARPVIVTGPPVLVGPPLRLLVIP